MSFPSLVDVGNWTHGAGTQEIVLPPGDTFIDDTVDIRCRAGAVIRGSGPNQSRIVWRGPANKPVFTFSASRGLILKDLTFVLQTPALAAIVVTNAGAGGAYNSTMNEFRNLRIDAARSSGKLQYGVVIDGSAYGGNGHNTEHHVIDTCNISGCTKAGIAVLSSQAHRCKILNNRISDCTIGFWLKQASQTVTDNWGAHCGLLPRAEQCLAGPLVFDRNNFEHVCRFAVCAAGRGEQQLLRNNRSDGMYPPPLTNAWLTEWQAATTQ